MTFKDLPAFANVCAAALTLFAGAGLGVAQQPSHIGPGSSPHAVLQKDFSEVVSAAAASDPADQICARSAIGSVVSDPPALSSANGLLEVTFHYKSVTDLNGLTRYCYVYTNTSGQTAEAPTLELNPGDQLILHFFNDLPAVSATDASAHAMHMMAMQPAATPAADAACSATTMTSSSTNLHFHGTNLPPVCHQDEVVNTLIQPQTSFDYSVIIPANEPTGVYWYHPHPHGFSEPQVAGGATGVILVEGIEEVNPLVANLPERVFVLRDQAVPNSVPTSPGVTRPQTDLSINYVPVTYPAYTPAVIQTAPSEKEFWRVLNTSADTLIDLQVVINGVAQPLQIVAVDGVPLTDSSGNATTATVTDYLMNAATRVEFVVTTPAIGATAQLVTLTHDNGPTGDPDPGRPIANIVSSATATATAPAVAAARRLPSPSATRQMTRFSAMDSSAPVAQRTLFFSVKSDFSAFFITLNGQTPKPFSMSDPPSIIVTEGTTEQWTIQNRSTMDHSFHIHQLHFQTLAINGTAVNDLTRRDTIDLPHWSGNGSDPYPSVTLLMDFRDPGIVGTFVYHCHILSHEDLGMMAKIQVLPGVTTTTLSASPTTAAAGSSVTFTATVAPTTLPTVGTASPTGTVTFAQGAATLGTGTLNSAGVATFTTRVLPIGSNAITASYAGDTSYAASTAAATTVVVTPATTSTVLTSSAATIAPGSSVTLTATVTATSSNGTPAGTVTFQNGGATLGTGTLNSSGVATYTATGLSAGSASFTAVYAGNAAFAPSTSTPLPVSVQTATTTTLAASSASTVFGSSVTLTATVKGSTGAAIPTGTVTFQNAGLTLGTASLDGTGVAAYTTTQLPAGTLSITAVYGGSTAFAGSTSAAVPVVVAPDFGIALAPTSASVAPGASGSSTLTITPLGGFNAAVSFACTGLPTLATCSFSPASLTPDGTHPITTAMTVKTTATTVSEARPSSDVPLGPLYAVVLPGLGALLGLRSTRKRLPGAARWLCVLGLALLAGFGLGACGGGGSKTNGSPGTPAGNSTITVTATAGATVHTSTFTLTVQ